MTSCALLHGVALLAASLATEREKFVDRTVKIAVNRDLARGDEWCYGRTHAARACTDGASESRPSGRLRARLEPGPPLPFRTQKAQALLAYLALSAGRSHRRDKLAALLWGEMPDEQARNSLRHALYELRRSPRRRLPPPCRSKATRWGSSRQRSTSTSRPSPGSWVTRPRSARTSRDALSGGPPRGIPPQGRALRVVADGGARASARPGERWRSSSPIRAGRAPSAAALRTGHRLLTLDPLEEPCIGR